MDRAGLAQLEACDLCLEARAADRDHLIGALHRPEGRVERTPRRVLEALAGLEHGLLADHARAAHLLDASRGVADQPAPRDQLAGLAAFVRDADRVEEE